jgi:fatty acid-binding protein DegV
MGVAVVTDSTAYLSPGVADRYGVTEVPLHVVLGDRTARRASRCRRLTWLRRCPSAG